MWYLEKLTGRGGILGSTLPNTFEGHRFESEEDLLIRETTQNTKDNPASGAVKPKIVIRSLTLTGQKKKDFLKSIDLKSLYGNQNLLAKTPSFSELKGAGKDAPLGLLFIEDFNTTGLDGKVDDPEGNWMRFNLHGDAAKLEQDLKIGSYGYGKSVLSRAAGTNTFIVFTVIAPNRSDRNTARLMGHTFQPWFREDNGQKSGRGWLCESEDEQGDPVPYSNGAATDLALKAGFTPRSGKDTGTSFLLIGTKPGSRQITISSIRRAFETWWWPAIVDDQIDIELWEDGKRVEGPAPRLRRDLKPYLAAKTKLATGIGEDVTKVTFDQLHGKQLGSLALTLAADESIFDSPLHPKSPGPRRVARTRAHSGMVTEYREFGTARRLAFVGYFSGADAVDTALKYAEPATHDEWSRVSQRLARMKHGADLVAAIEDRTDSACLTFQRKNSAARAQPTDRLPALERLLGAAFEASEKGGARRGKKKKVVTRNTVIGYPGQANDRPTPVFGTSTNHLDFLIRYSLKPQVTKPRKVKVWFDLNVAEDAHQAKGSPLGFEIIDQATSRKVTPSGDSSFTLSMAPGKSRTFRFKSEAYPRHQVVLFEEGEASA